MEKDIIKRNEKEMKLKKIQEDKFKQEYLFTPTISERSKLIRNKSPVFERLFEKKIIHEPNKKIDPVTGQKYFQPKINTSSSSISSSFIKRTDELYEEAIQKQVRQETVKELIDKTNKKKRNPKRISKESEYILKKKLRKEIEDEYEKYDIDRVGSLDKKNIKKVMIDMGFLNPTEKDFDKYYENFWYLLEKDDLMRFNDFLIYILAIMFNDTEVLKQFISIPVYL